MTLFKYLTTNEKDKLQEILNLKKNPSEKNAYGEK
jgi:hypothetical protein